MAGAAAAEEAGGGATTASRELPLDPSLIDGVVGQPAERLFEGIHAEDRQVRKAAKAATRKANAHFTDLCGVFVLGVGRAASP